MKRTLSILIFLVVLLLSSCKIKSQAEIDAEKYVYENATIEHFFYVDSKNYHIRVYKYPDLNVVDEEDIVYNFLKNIQYVQTEYSKNNQKRELGDTYSIYYYDIHFDTCLKFWYREKIIEVESYVDGHFWTKYYSRYYKITENDCNTLVGLIEEIGNQ